MKTSKACTKCGCSQVVRYPGRKLGFGGGNYINTGVFSAALVDRVVCLECGFCEEWVSARGMEILRKKHGYVRFSSGPGDD